MHGLNRRWTQRKVGGALLGGAMLVAGGLTGVEVLAQTSSLYVTEPQPAIAPPPSVARLEPVISSPTPPPGPTLSPAIAEASFMAARRPELRQFAVHDLVTIIVRESTKMDVEGSLETEKKTATKGAIKAFPRLTLSELLKLNLSPSAMEDGDIKLDVSFNKDFEGDGSFSRNESVTSRVTARIIDVKPNGTLVLEARKFLKADDEEMDLIVTGICRAEDIASDNTILSTQLYDLHLNKQHRGEIRNATKKGLLTRVLEGLFAF